MACVDPFDDCIEKNISFIKRHKFDAESLTNRYLSKDLSEICEYLGLKYIKGEKELEKAKRLLTAIYR